MAKKPADQTSTNGANGAGDAVDLEQELDGDASGSGAGDADEDDDDDEDGSDGAGGTDVAAQIEAGIKAALPLIQQQFQSEMDRRINSALNKSRKPKDGEDGDEGSKPPAAAGKSDVRGARLAFREILPDSIKLLGDEERALANEFGTSLIRARAAQGFDDEEEVGREAATETAKFLRRARDLYSARTKRVLEKSGALVPQGGGQSPNGADKPSTVAAAFEAAAKKDRELFPERYVGK